MADPRVPAFPLPRLAEGATVTVGSFDGVHLGHQAVLGEIDRRAHAAGRASLLVTFDPHPLEVVNPEAAPPLLTTGPERLEILALSPLDYVVLLRFDRHVHGARGERRTGADRRLQPGRLQDCRVRACLWLVRLLRRHDSGR